MKSITCFSACEMGLMFSAVGVGMLGKVLEGCVSKPGWLSVQLAISMSPVGGL